MLNKIKRNIINKISNPPAYLNIVLGVVVLALIVSYLWQINLSTKLGLQLYDVHKQQQAAWELNRDLQLTVASYQSIANLEERLAGMPLAQVNDLDYIELTSVESVAKK